MYDYIDYSNEFLLDTVDPAKEVTGSCFDTFRDLAGEKSLDK